ncbi:MAG: ADOP family duplicated permease [Terriglobales bacterium]
MRLVRRLRHLLRPSRQRELAEEMRFHQEMLARDGAASARFGNELLLRERSRDAWGWVWLTALVRDLRYALRMLRRAPLFALVAVLSLAIGIAANTSVYSLVDAVALRWLPVRDPGRLITLYWAAHRWRPDSSHSTADFHDESGRLVDTTFSYPQWQQWRSGAAAVVELAGFQNLNRLDVSTGGAAERVAGMMVSGNFDAVVGLTPALGRGINAGDNRPGAPLVAEISYGFWRSQMGGDADVLGRTIEINGLPATVVGVGPRAFTGLEAGYSAAVIVPVGAVTGPLGQRVLPHPPSLTDANSWWLETIGRLRSGATVSAAQAALRLSFDQAAAGMRQDPEVGKEKPELLVVPAGHGIDANFRNLATLLLLLRCFVALVLLIAVVNLANLLIARTAARGGELALRMAIGAGRSAIARQLLAEALLLAALGGMAALPLAALIQRWVAGALPMNLALGLDARVLGFDALVALAAGMALGLATAWRAGRSGPQPALQAAGAPGDAPAGRRLARILMTAQLAICLLVLAGAGLFLRTLRNLQSVDTGFNARHLVLFNVAPGADGFRGAQLGDFYAGLLARLRALPGVTAAAASDKVPAGEGRDSTSGIALTPAAAHTRNPRTYTVSVSPGFFTTYDLPLRAGREFGPADSATAEPVAIVNQTMARRFPNGALGHNLYWGARVLRVVGVAADASYRGVQEGPVPVVYTPVAQQLDSVPLLSFVLRSPLSAAALAPAIRSAVADLSPSVPVTNLETQQEAMAATYLAQNLLAGSCGGLAIVVLLLAAIGLYGLIAFAVVRRTREFGIRIALGATRAGVARLILRETLVIVALGAGAGLALSLAAGQALQSLLFQVSPRDPLTLGVAAAFLALIALLAAAVPTLRATRLSPLTALRQE